MSSVPTTRIACASPAFVERADQTTLDDWLSYFDPSIVLLTGDSPAPRAASLLRRHVSQDTLVFEPGGNVPDSGPHNIDGVQFILAPTLEILRNVDAYESDSLDVTLPTFVLSNLLELDVDTTTLSTSLIGREAYTAALDSSQLAGTYIHLSSNLPAEYRRAWDDLTVIGGGADSGVADNPLTALDCRTDGRVLTRSVNRSQLGLQALEQVGRTRARQLREAGFTSREVVANADPGDLRELPGVGVSTAERIHHSATALANDDIVRLSDDPLPNGEPVYIDIETDDITPTITWLIGVLDGTAADGEYMSFIQTNPNEPAGAIEEFIAWYTTNASHRPLVAYNGWKFDFSVIHDHIIRYCPHFEADWTSSYRFDPYQWAVKDDHAILPGRTNKLEDVATALGYERHDTGLTGAAVARAYQRWMADQTPATELEWERYASYCEDDVRGLAVIYEALEETGRIISENEPSRGTNETTTQQTLSDW
jgi:uncharacterized protein YprB with RNaseH-like and TPR domain